MTRIQDMGIPNVGKLPQMAMDVAISVAADVLHLWPSLDGYDAMTGVADIVADADIMVMVPEYSKTNPFGAVDKDDKPSEETEERFRKSGWKPVEQTYWAVKIGKSGFYPTALPDDVKDKIWNEMDIGYGSPSHEKNAPWTRYYEQNQLEWNEVASMAMYPFKPRELMTGPVHYGEKYDNLQKALRNAYNLNLYHVVMSYPHWILSGLNEPTEKGFVAVWPFSKQGRMNNDMAFLSLENGNMKMLFGENAYAAWIEERDQMIGNYESINVQTIF